jgi:hypothetical protein
LAGKNLKFEIPEYVPMAIAEAVFKTDLMNSLRFISRLHKFFGRNRDKSLLLAGFAGWYIRFAQSAAFCSRGNKCFDRLGLRYYRYRHIAFLRSLLSGGPYRAFGLKSGAGIAFCIVDKIVKNAGVCHCPDLPLPTRQARGFVKVCH